MAIETGKNIFDKWNLEIDQRIIWEDRLENVYFSNQHKILQLKRKMNNDSGRKSHLKVIR